MNPTSDAIVNPAMDVYLVPVGTSRYELYCEVPDEPDEPEDTPSKGFIHRIRVQYFQGPRFNVALVLEVAIPHEQLRVFSTDEFKPPANPEDWKFPVR